MIRAALAGLGALAALPLLLFTGSDAGGIPTAEVREGPFRVTIVEPGTIQALRSVTYASSIQSNQAKIVAMVAEGRMVQKGDLLILFDSAPFEEEIRRSQALLAQAEASQARSDALLTKESLRQLGSAAAYRLEQRRAAVSAAESRIQEAASKLALAREQLGKTEVRADVPGIAVHREVFFGSEKRKPQVGDQVWANQPLLILPDVSRMVVETSARETDVHKVERNQRVRVQAYPDLRLTGTVTLVGTLAHVVIERGLGAGERAALRDPTAPSSDFSSGAASQ